MTPALEPEDVVEYELRCFRRAPIVTTEKTASCANCGKVLGIRRVKRQHWKIAPHQRPWRKLRVEDLGALMNHIGYYLLLGFGLLYVYYLGVLLGLVE